MANSDVSIVMQLGSQAQMIYKINPPDLLNDLVRLWRLTYCLLRHGKAYLLVSHNQKLFINKTSASEDNMLNIINKYN